MDRNHNEGNKHEPKGNVKETLNKPGGNPAQRFDSQHEKNAGMHKDARKTEDQVHREQSRH